MKKLVLVVYGLWFLLAGGTVYAEDPVAEPAVASDDSAVINHPKTGWELTKSAINYLEPGADYIWSFNSDNFSGISGALYTFTSKGWPIASIRAGYGLDPVTYGSLCLDLPGLVGRFLPASVKGVSPGALNGAIAFAAKYLRTGLVAGYDWNDTTPVWGASVGAAATINF